MDPVASSPAGTPFGAIPLGQAITRKQRSGVLVDTNDTANDFVVSKPQPKSNASGAPDAGAPPDLGGIPDLSSAPDLAEADSAVMGIADPPYRSHSGCSYVGAGPSAGMLWVLMVLIGVRRRRTPMRDAA
jgi:MYXO-CTERM domain-containing protein